MCRIHVMYMWAPGSDILPPSGKRLPHAKIGKGLDPDQLVEVVEVPHPLVQVSELWVPAGQHASDPTKAEGGEVLLVHLGVDNNPRGRGGGGGGGGGRQRRGEGERRGREGGQRRRGKERNTLEQEGGEGGERADN